VNRVDAVRPVQEVRRGFARATNAGKFDDFVRFDAKLVRGIDDAHRNRVVSATWAECARQAFVVGFLEASFVQFRFDSSSHFTCLL
jgi:hypothetical protein